jgi:uracil-DNA glycosylase
METLLAEIRCCTICAASLPLGPRPILQASSSARLVIIGQAPGSRVHATGIPWADPSGKLLRSWLGISDTTFYDPARVALIPMGFCYPGKGSSGDLPPRPECAPAWHAKVLAHLPKDIFTLLIGSYAQGYYLGAGHKGTLTENVRAHHVFLPGYLPLPHPSPRNRAWLKHNPWFQDTVLPVLQARVKEVLLDSRS